MRARAKRRKASAAADVEAAAVTPLTTGASNFKLYFKLAAKYAFGSGSNAKYRDDCKILSAQYLCLVSVFG
jgi:hypothetical protein